MRINEVITEVFQPGRTNWEWARRSTDEASAFFKVGNREYLWQAFTERNTPLKWEIQFRLLRDYDNDPDELDLFGKTGTGNSAQVLSTAVDIIRAFLNEYGLDKVEEITFNAKEDSRIALYAKMIKRLLPNWDLYSKKDPVDGMTFTLTDRRAYDKPENKINELFDPQTSYQLEWDDQFGPKEIHARAYDRQGKYIDINFVPVRDNVTDIEFSKMDSFDLTNDEDGPRVFATVLEAIRRYLQGYQPKILIFSGKEKNRAGLYQRLINRFASQYGYKQFDTSKLSPDAQRQMGGTNVFVLRKATSLNELRGIKKDFGPDDSAKQVLTRYGFEQIGFGTYGTVWAHPKLDYVLKTFSQQDKAYLNWVAFCSQHKNNPHIPKFISAKPLLLATGIYAVRMERLAPAQFNYERLVGNISKLVSDCIYDRPDIKTVEDVVEHIETKYGSSLAYLKSFVNDTPLLEAILLIVEFIRSGQGHPDINIRNIMLRGDTMVFTDPVI